MKIIINAGAAYFLSYASTFLLDKIVELNINELLTSILSFISVIIKFPNNIFSIFLKVSGQENVFLTLCGFCFVIKIIVFFLEKNL